MLGREQNAAYAWVPYDSVGADASPHSLSPYTPLPVNLLLHLGASSMYEAVKTLIVVYHDIRTLDIVFSNIPC